MHKRKTAKQKLNGSYFHGALIIAGLLGATRLRQIVLHFLCGSSNADMPESPFAVETFSRWDNALMQESRRAHAQ